MNTLNRNNIFVNTLWILVKVVVDTNEVLTGYLQEDYEWHAVQTDTPSYNHLCK